MTFAPTPATPHRSVIPTGAWVMVAVMSALCFFVMNVIFVRDPNVPAPVRVLVPVLAAAVLGGYILLLGYIYGDARRRGMRYIAWTVLAALAPSAIGIILYFILRDPIPVHCTRCGVPVRRGFAYCPRCGAGMSPTCPQCHKVAEAGWTHCAWCGTGL